MGKDLPTWFFTFNAYFDYEITLFDIFQTKKIAWKYANENDSTTRSSMLGAHPNMTSNALGKVFRSIKLHFWHLIRCWKR